MRVVLAVAVFAALIGAVVASDVEVEAEGEGAAETDVEHPVLPALGSPCLPRRSRSRNWRVVSQRPRSFRGTCTTEAACPAAQHEPGYCAGIGVVCCKAPQQPQPSTKVEADVVGAPTTPATTPAATVPAAAAATTPVSAGPATVPSGIVLKSGTTPCQTQGGTCGTPASCTAKKGTTKSGLCPGSSTNICCFVKAATPTTPTPTPTTPTTPTAPATTSLTALVKIPAGINPGLTIAGAKGLTAKIGQPGCPLTTKCFDCNCAISNTKITKNRVTMAVTDTVRITGLKPFVEAVARAFAAIKAAGATNPLLMRVYKEVKTAGGLCCRPIKRSNGTAGGTWSNHSWGAAVDFYFGNSIDPRGDGKTQYGLSLMAPYFAAQKLYWAAGYKGSEEDAMHFEASQQALNAWPAL